PAGRAADPPSAAALTPQVGSRGPKTTRPGKKLPRGGARAGREYPRPAGDQNRRRRDRPAGRSRAMPYGLLADLLVALHVAYVSYVAVGQLLIWLGLALRWRWVRNPYFRWTHLLMIAVVAAEAVLDWPCP